MGPVALTLSATQALARRIATTGDDLSFVPPHRPVAHRPVAHRAGTTATARAPLRRTRYSRGPRHDLVLAAHRRYPAVLCDLADPSAGVRRGERLAAPRRHDARSYRGSHRCSAAGGAPFTALARGERQISGLRTSSRRRVLPQPRYTGPPLARRLKRLHVPSLASSRKSGTPTSPT